MRGAGPASRGRRSAGPRRDVIADGLCRGRPDHGPVGEFACDLQHPRAECPQQQRNGVPRSDGQAVRVGGPVLAVEVCGLPLQQGGNDPRVLLGAPAGVVVGHAVDAADHRLMRWPDPEGEAGSPHRVHEGGDPVRLE